MKRILTVLAVLLIAACLPVWARQLPEGAVTDGAAFMPKYKNPTPGQMPIMMWSATAIEGNKLMLSDEWYEGLKELNVNLFTGLNGTDQQLDSILELAGKHELKMFLFFFGTKSTEKVSSMVRKWRNNKAVGGYLPWDEPNASDFTALRDVRNAIFTMDTTRTVLVNLYPIVPPKVSKTPTYQDYVEKSMSELKTGLLSYDNYPIKLQDGRITVRDNFYENLEIVSSDARRAGWPFWAFALVLGHNNYAPPVESDIRFEVFNALAYGAQGIEYWRYTYTNSGDFNSTIAPIDQNGQRTALWYGVQRVNREIQGLTPVFLDGEVVSLGHVGKVPNGAEALEKNPGPLKSIKCGRQGVLVSQIRNEDRNYIVIVNHEPRKSQKVKLKFDGTLARIFPDGSTVNCKSGTFRLAAGGYLIFRY